MKKYQVMVAIGDLTLIDGTNKKKQVDEWIDGFNKNSIPSSILKVFQRDDEADSYKLVHSINVPSEHPTERLIGFGRW